MIRKAFLICLLILFGIPSVAPCEQPIDVLRKTLNLGIAVLKDPQYRDAAKKSEQQEILCDAAWQVFDFKEFSRRVLASEWQSFTPEQRREFIEVFAEFLCKYYITRLQEKYSDEKVIYLSQQLIANSRASVKVNVLWKGTEVPVEVRMLRRNSTWKVYDIIVLGISGVKNYRAQFQAILRDSTPSQVIGQIRDRIKKEEIKRRLIGKRHSS